MTDALVRIEFATGDTEVARLLPEAPVFVAAGTQTGLEVARTYFLAGRRSGPCRDSITCSVSHRREKFEYQFDFHVLPASAENTPRTRSPRCASICDTARC